MRAYNGERLGSSDQLWEDIESGYHVDAKFRRHYVRDISRFYAENLIEWYLRAAQTDEEVVRLRNSEMFKTLEVITKRGSYERMVGLEKEVRVATIVTFDNEVSYDVILEDADKVNIGDTIVAGSKNDDEADRLVVGLVKYISYKKRIDASIRVLKDVITNSSNTFIEFRNKVRREEIEKVIEERMKVIDERQAIEMYAKADTKIKDLLEELDELES